MPRVRIIETGEPAKESDDTDGNMPRIRIVETGEPTEATESDDTEGQAARGKGFDPSESEQDDTEGNKKHFR